ncbi:SGNH/GDSL hydrolase family protein [Rossellomorea sp. NPDC077527]|uniref:SGNH/GDSL hydrolase family protein n=1 Tax=Rossellomorea sp. NPDC077527 TaxID=3364510 RepID=UPI0037C788AA
MKNFLLVLLTIGCCAFLILGNTYWHEKTAVSSYSKQPTMEKVDSAPTEEKSESPLYSNWPERAQKAYKDAVENGQAYKVAIVGSPALGAEENGWSVQLKEELENAYSESMEVSVFQYDTDSLNFINGEEVDEVISFSPDMVLYEPFSLNNNSVGVLAEDNQDSIGIFLEKLKGANEDVVLLLQPSHPIFGATYYPMDVEKLRAYAEEKGITYLDHWSEWPTDESLKDMLVESQDTPNEKGYTLWTDYLTDYFISEKE